MTFPSLNFQLWLLSQVMTCSIKVLRVLGRAVRQKARIELIIASKDGANISLTLVA